MSGPDGTGHTGQAQGAQPADPAGPGGVRRVEADLVVVGSINVDRGVRVAALPAPGETVAGSDLTTGVGGKGANQARAAARLGARVALVGCVGDDAEGEWARAEIESAGVRVEQVHRQPGRPTGTALITVDAAGENTIALAAGANAALSADLVMAGRDRVAGVRVVVAQGETPADAIGAAAALAHEWGARFVLNLAPVLPLPPGTLAAADPLVVNEHEAAQLLGATPDHSRDPAAAPPGPAVPDPVADPVAAARALVGRGCRSAVVTLGARGAAWATGDGAAGRVPALPVAEVVDTTGAGDASVAALAVALAGGARLADAVAMGNVVGAHTVGLPGASPAMPSPDRVERDLRRL